jgi:3-methylcrotonyl-CoA carboxylase alpha subunit
VAPNPRAWRNNPNQPVVDRFAASDGQSIAVRLSAQGTDRYAAELVMSAGAHQVSVWVAAHAAPDLALELNGHCRRAVVVEAPLRTWWVALDGDTHELIWLSPFPDPTHTPRHETALTAPMPGQVVAVLVAEGQRVRANDPLLILLAMKMEHVITSPHDGIAEHLQYRVGESVPAGAVLLDVRPETESGPPDGDV